MTILDYYFGNKSMMGSFELDLCRAWTDASESNKHRLERAFPEYFPMAMMYGNPEGDFRSYASREQLDKSLEGRLVKTNVWGRTEDAILTTWNDIKSRGFKVRNRTFSSHEGKDVLFFNQAHHFTDNHVPYVNYITYETLEQIAD